MQEIHLERTALEAVVALEIPKHAMKRRDYVHMDVQVPMYRKRAASMLVRSKKGYLPGLKLNSQKYFASYVNTYSKH